MDPVSSEKPSVLIGASVADGESLAWGSRTYVMGVINVTPDSFSGDGLGKDKQAAVDRALRFQDEGADFLDIGAESTRPGHTPVEEYEELARLLPALQAITDRVSIPISVDTSKSAVAERALESGATIINDVWGLRADPELSGVVASHGAGLILMHNQRSHAYEDLLGEIVGDLRHCIDDALSAGILGHNLIVDPGFGFGKTADQNLELLRNLMTLRQLGLPVLVGTSRKSTIGRLLGLPGDQRAEGTSATVAMAIAGGADVVRVHDVKEMVRVCRVTDAIVRGWRPEGWETGR